MFQAIYLIYLFLKNTFCLLKKKLTVFLADTVAFTTNSTLKQFENFIKIPKK